MIKFDPYLDFYGSWVTKAEINANLKEQIEYSEAAFKGGLIEIEEKHYTSPPIDRFSKCFEWAEEFSTTAYNHYLPQLYSAPRAKALGLEKKKSPWHSQVRLYLVRK
jgi:hypothetical protein